jgi:class 3 adenylate cyclase
MTAPVPAGPSVVPVVPASTYRCFLFADLRGYTSFIERAGNAAGVELLDEYLDITRAAVAEHHGAEIKVEGDGFHAVFPSASSAVMCGLAIVEAAEKKNAANPERALHIGVGVHAGEALETADGYIGSAVNIASRVCASAASGEVLVTSTVRGITQASIPVGFAARGRRRLKGIPEPVELFAVVPQGRAMPRASRRMDTRWLTAAGLVAALSVAALALLFVLGPGSNRPTPTPRPTIATSPLVVGALPIGTYRADQFERPFRFVVGDLGWTLYRYQSEAIGLLREDSPAGRLDVTRVESLYANPCIPEDDLIPAGSTPDELVSALRQVSFLEVGDPTLVFIGGRPGVEINVTVDPGAQAACGSFGGAGIALLPAGGEAYVAQGGEQVRLVAVDLDGTAVTFLASLNAASPTSSVAELQEFLDVADRIIKSSVF